MGEFDRMLYDRRHSVRRRSSLVLSLTLVVMVVLPIANSADSTGRRVALVIGNSKYQSVPELTNPKNDAQLIGRALRAAQFSTDIQLDLARGDLERALRNFRSKADGADVALIYFAGHGLEASGRNWLIPIDATLTEERDLSFQAIDLQTVVETIAAARGLRIVVLDACRDNPFTRSIRRISGTRGIGTRGLGDIEVAGTLVFYAQRAGHTALDGAGANSPFAQALAKRIPEPGVDIRLLVSKVRDDVLSLTNNRQEPFSYGSLPGIPLELTPKLSTPQATSQRIEPGKATAPAPERDRISSPATKSRPRIIRQAGDEFRDDLTSGGSGPWLTVIPSGAFEMGSAPNEPYRTKDEGPVRSLSIASIAVSKTELTFEQYDRFVTAAHARHPDDFGLGRGNRPVVDVSWNEAHSYVDWLSKQTGHKYRLLSEAEWEYAARAGSKSVYQWPSNRTTVCEVANLLDRQGKEFGRNQRALARTQTTSPGSSTNSRGNLKREERAAVMDSIGLFDPVSNDCNDRYGPAAPADAFPANTFGLHNMIGNVSEWTEDCYSPSYDASRTTGEPVTSGRCSLRIRRGGSYDTPMELARYATRTPTDLDERFPDTGIRIARVLD